MTSTLRTRLFGGAVALSLTPLLGLHACSLPGRPSDSPDGGACVEGCIGVDASTDAPIDASTTSIEPGVGKGSRNSQCGTTAMCDPDGPLSGTTCAVDLDTSQLPSGNGLIPTVTGPLDREAGVSLGLDPHDGGGSSAGDTAPKHKACQVLPSSAGPQATCVFTGSGEDGDACERADQCSPGLACVKDTDTQTGSDGHCRPYCCAIPSVCDAGRYCASRKRAEALTVTDLVPVCLPADNCKLLEQGACAAGAACTIMAGGLTTCDAPGTGHEGQPCSCAEGFVCITSLNVCRRICHLSVAGECGSGKCVASSATYPAGFGVCASDE